MFSTSNRGTKQAFVICFIKCLDCSAKIVGKESHLSGIQLPQRSLYLVYINARLVSTIYFKTGNDIQF